MDALQKAIDIVGGLAQLGKACGVSYQAVQKWLKTCVPAEKVLPIYRATCGAVTPHELRPDLYPDPAWVPPLDASWWPDGVEQPPSKEAA